MSDRVRTLLLDANGWGGWKAVASETILRGVLGLRDRAQLPALVRETPLARRLLRDRYAGLSYAMDWRDAFAADPRLDVELCNILDLVELRRARRKIAEYPLVVVLHSATGDNMAILRRAASWFQRRRGSLVVFVGNEYNLLDDKLAFIRESGAEFVASQLPIESARWLYAGCPDAHVLAMPHALNPSLYHPVAGSARTTDVGFVGAQYPAFIGDRERAHILEYFAHHGGELGLVTDIRHSNMPRQQWAAFLNGCKAVVGAEAGTYYLDRSGTLIPEIERFQRERPDAGFDEIFDRYFRDRPTGVSGKAISSRHFEPIGTRTAQILLEGHYNGILHADEHFIAVKKDLSNVREAVDRFRDTGYREAMVARTYDYVLDQHTYAHRVSALIDAVASPAARPALAQPG